MKEEILDNYIVSLQSITHPKFTHSVRVSKKMQRTGRVKLLSNFGFRSYDSADLIFIQERDKIRERIDDRTSEKLALKKLNSKLVASDHFKVGDIVVNTWGYDQTNVAFYIVERVLNKKIQVREIGQRSLENSHGFMCCDVIPDPSATREKTYLLSLKSDKNGTVWICNPKSYYYFHKWSGKSMYKSWYA